MHSRGQIVKAKKAKIAKPDNISRPVHDREADTIDLTSTVISVRVVKAKSTPLVVMWR